MNVIRFLLFRGLLLVTLVGSYVYLTYGSGNDTKRASYKEEPAKLGK
jgi:hypothetical protein